MVHGKGRNAGLGLLVWNGKEATVADHFTVDDVKYLPLDLGTTLGRGLLLPTGAAGYESTRKLFEIFSALVSRVTRLPESPNDRT
jgi:hypothetical protein